MSVGVPPRTRPVFDPISGRVIGIEPNPDFYAFFGLGPGSDPNAPGSNPAGLGSVNPDGSVVTPFTDIDVPTGMLFDMEEFEDLGSYDAAVSGLVPDFYRDPITGEVDPARSGLVDHRGRPAGMFNQGMEGVALDNWARNHPQEAAELYWAMAPIEVDPITGEIIGGQSHLTPGEQRQIALAIGPELIDAERDRLRREAGLDVGEESQPGGPNQQPGSLQQGDTFTVDPNAPSGPPVTPITLGETPPPAGYVDPGYSGPGSRYVQDQIPFYLDDVGGVDHSGAIPYGVPQGPPQPDLHATATPYGVPQNPPITPSYTPPGSGGPSLNPDMGITPVPSPPSPSGIGFNADSESATLYDPPPVPGMVRNPVTGEWMWPNLIPVPIGPPNQPY